LLFQRDKKEEVKEEEKKEEEEKPRTRKTSFMRSVIRNFSMELMMKTMQYGWADLGQCRYLRKRGGDDDDDQDTSGANTLAKDTMKVGMTDVYENWKAMYFQSMRTKPVFSLAFLKSLF